MYSLTDDAKRRDELLNLAVENNVELHFAQEVCFLKTKEDLKHIKYCPPVSRFDNVYIDKNLVCSCPSIDEYKDTAA